RELERVGAGVDYSLEELECLDDVGLEIQRRLRDGLRDLDLAGKVDDRADRMLCDQPRDQLTIGDVASHERDVTWEWWTRPGRKIVEDDHARSLGGGCMDEVASDKARSTGHEESIPHAHGVGTLPR